MNALTPVVNMLGGIVGPYVEVVLHDLTQPEHSVVAIANGHISNRTLGSSILSGPKDDKAFATAIKELSVRGDPVHSVVQTYPTVTASGQQLKSATVIFRDTAGDPFAALCLNADLSMFHLALAWLERLVDTKSEPVPVQEDAPEMDVLMRDIISDAVRAFGKPVSMMSKEEKLHAVKAMMQRGLFIVKGGVERAAKALGVTRFTVYNYLDELRRRNGTAEARVGAPPPASRTKRRAT